MDQSLFQSIEVRNETSAPFTADVMFDVSHIFVPLSSSTNIGKSVHELERDILHLEKEESKARSWLVDNARTGGLRLWRQMLEKRADVNMFSTQSIRELQSFYSHESSERDKTCVRLEWRVRMKLYAQHETDLNNAMQRSRLSLQERGGRVGVIEKEEAASWLSILVSHLVHLEGLHRAEVDGDNNRRRGYIEDVQKPISVAIAAIPLEEQRYRSSIATEWREEVLPLGDTCSTTLLHIHSTFVEDRDDLCGADVLGRSTFLEEEFDELHALQRDEQCQRHSASCVDVVIIPEMLARRRLLATSTLLRQLSNFDQEWRTTRASIESSEPIDRRLCHSGLELVEEETTARWSLFIDLAANTTLELHLMWSKHVAFKLYTEFLRTSAQMSIASLEEAQWRHTIELQAAVEYQEIHARFGMQEEAIMERAQLCERRWAGAVFLEYLRHRVFLVEQQHFECELLVEDEATSVFNATSNEEASSRRALQDFWALVNGVKTLEQQEALSRLLAEERLQRESMMLSSVEWTQSLLRVCAAQSILLDESRARCSIMSTEIVSAKLLDLNGCLEPIGRKCIVSQRASSLTDCVERWSRSLIQSTADVERTVILEALHREDLVVAHARFRFLLFTDCLATVFESSRRNSIATAALSHGGAAWWSTATRTMQSLDPLWEAERRFRKQVEITERNYRSDLQRHGDHLAGALSASYSSFATSSDRYGKPPTILNSTQRKLYNEWADNVGSSSSIDDVALRNSHTLPSPVHRSPHPPSMIKPAYSSSSHQQRSSTLFTAVLPLSHSSPSPARRSLFQD